jgi:hypothetical protein
MAVNVSVWWEDFLERKNVIIFRVSNNFGINSEFARSPRKTIRLLLGKNVYLRNQLPLKNTEA